MNMNEGRIGSEMLCISIMPCVTLWHLTCASYDFMLYYMKWKCV